PGLPPCDFVERTAGLKDRIGKPLEASTKATQLTALRTFFRDCQEWEWLPRRFDPQRALATPRSIAALLGPDPRVIADEIWAKLLWAGLNLETADLPQNRAGLFYPPELVRAVTLTWLFSGRRSDEIARLRLGCIRWQHDGTAIAGDSQQVLARDAVCLLDVPTHKTGTAFSKPVDPILGQAIDAWQVVRPFQPRFVDRRTAEQVDLLFAFRARRISPAYINNTVIPMLCRKAGVPAADVRGNIPSHRARPTIASQLYNVKEPMTLFELQACAGTALRSPRSTTRRSPPTPSPRHTPTPSTSPGMSAPSRSLSTATPSPPAPPRLVSPGSTTTWDTASAATPFSSSASTEWPALAAISMPRKTPPRLNSSKPKTTCREWPPPSHSPTTNARLSTTARKHWTAYSTVWPTLRRPQARHHVGSTCRPLHASCHSSPCGNAAQARNRADIEVRTGSGECHSHCRDLDGRTRRLLRNWPDRPPELRNVPG
ncbi:hypothetical protein ACFV23_19175, partial [Streptomyces sp. NPDC059627]